MLFRFVLCSRYPLLWSDVRFIVNGCFDIYIRCGLFLYIDLYDGYRYSDTVIMDLVLHRVLAMND